MKSLLVVYGFSDESKWALPDFGPLQFCQVLFCSAVVVKGHSHILGLSALGPGCFTKKHEHSACQLPLNCAVKKTNAGKAQQKGQQDTKRDEEQLAYAM